MTQPSLQYLGIDIGSVNVKVTLWHETDPKNAIIAHEGHIQGALRNALDTLGLPEDGRDVRAVVTGGAGRLRVAVPDVIAPQAIEAALAHLGLSVRAVVSVGGEDLVVFTLGEDGRIQNTYAGNKCASGTGEFFRQQLGRMDMTLDDLDFSADSARLLKLSARCSVFMKSDCTHRLNKGEATRQDIALSLSRVMADKVSEFLVKAKIRSGHVLLTGGVTRNRFFVDFLRANWPEIEFVVPEMAQTFESFGAALLARTAGGPLPPREVLLRPRSAMDYGLFQALPSVGDLVRRHPSRRAPVNPDAEYILGIDGGSTTTKIALVDAATMEVAAAHYGRTHGDPVAALKNCVREVLSQLGGVKPKIRWAATTGSSRELLGVFTETDGVYNEIIAHTVGTTYFEPEVDTIFEIGGQDAKYVLLNNGVPIDYAMNEACSAGTGSFLEESAASDLDIHCAEHIGPVALAAESPLKFGEHCSAFINSDIRKAITGGAPSEDIVAGLIFSIVSNYLNRVVGNRTIGDHIALQGGVAKNPAVPLAFAQLVGKPISVPPDPELMGCFGVARLAKLKHDEGLLPAGEFDLQALLDKEIVYRGEFVCRACDNLCPIRNLEVGGRRYPFGGRCSKYTGARRRKGTDEPVAVDHVAARTALMFEDWARFEDLPAPVDHGPVVGVPLAFSVHSLWPFYARWFAELGVRVQLSEKVIPQGVAKQESNYCFPAEIAHGAIQDLLDRGVDTLFLPHFRDMPSMEEGRVHACVCPLTQGLPYYARHAFGLRDDQILAPVVSFKHGWNASRAEFEALAVRLGRSSELGGFAYDAAIHHFQRFLEDYRARGRELLEEIKAHPERQYVALLGRPYNAFTKDANMGIPRKFTSRGVTVIPFDLIYDESAGIFPNMYWYYGQQDMKAVRRVRDLPNLVLCWVSNFSCAPDSFMLHYLRWMMGEKPYLVLEMDSHTADAGLDTRIEAFLDIVESYRRHVKPSAQHDMERRFRVHLKKAYADVEDTATGERVDIRDPRVLLVWPPMGDLSTELVAAASRKQGIRTEHLAVPDVRSTQLARNVASGKECIPALLVLGSMLQFLDKHRPSRPDEIILIYVPSTLGPCRTGQYYVFYDHLLHDMGFENVVLFVGEGENSYREFGPGFTKDLWQAVVLSDYFTDIRHGIRLLAKDPEEGLRVFDACWKDVVASVARGGSEYKRSLARCTEALSNIPKKKTMDQVKKVMVVGEIYVRRDNFSVEELVSHLIDQGIYPKLAGVTEWIYYMDWSQRFLLGDQLKRDGLVRAVLNGWLKDRAWLGLESWYKHRVDHQVKHALMPTGFLAEVFEDMDAALEQGAREFVSPEMESEATISPAVAAAAMQHGYHGVAIIAPFGCLPGRVIEGVYAPWAKQRGYPVVALENDGQPYPPNIISRLEVFSHNVLRYEAPREGQEA